MFLAACDLAYRFGMETTGYEGTILAEAGYKGNQIILKKQIRQNWSLERQTETA